MACVLEASAPKAGNVHPGQSFADMHFAHFVAAADCIADSIANNVGSMELGELIWQCVQVTLANVGVNTSLGTILLVAPIAHAQQSTEHGKLPDRIANLLAILTADDSQWVYRAIAHCSPGGIGEEQENDIRGSAPPDLVKAMEQVAHMDAVARQYVNAFEDVFQLAEWLADELKASQNILDAICRLQIRWLSQNQDGLIIRKLGEKAAKSVQDKAAGVAVQLNNYSRPLAETPDYQEFDLYLRSDRNRLNPGTTADLIAAALFVRLLEGYAGKA